MILQAETKTLRQKIRAMWEQKLDTKDMSKALQIPEALVERELHAALEIKRAIVNSLVAE
jgi:hypothetical protein